MLLLYAPVMHASSCSRPASSCTRDAPIRLANPEEYEVVMNEPPLDMATLRGSGAAPSSRALTQKKKPPAARGVGIVQVGTQWGTHRSTVGCTWQLCPWIIITMQ